MIYCYDISTANGHEIYKKARFIHQSNKKKQTNFLWQNNPWFMVPGDLTCMGDWVNKGFSIRILYFKFDPFLCHFDTASGGQPDLERSLKLGLSQIGMSNSS